MCEMHFVYVWENQIYDEGRVIRLRAWSRTVRVLCSYLTFVSTRDNLVYYMEVIVHYCS
jgi:hypothetical protein